MDDQLVFREELFDVPEGGFIALKYPSELTDETLMDFCDWMEIVLRKMKRRAGRTRKPEPPHA